jgi:hypothetical protein
MVVNSLFIEMSLLGIWFVLNLAFICFLVSVSILVVDLLMVVLVGKLLTTCIVFFKNLNPSLLLDIVVMHKLRVV